MSKLIRLALADDQALVRMGLKALLGSFENLEVVIEAENGEQLLNALPDNPVDVILFPTELTISSICSNVTWVFPTAFKIPFFNFAGSYCSRLPSRLMTSMGTSSIRS